MSHGLKKSQSIEFIDFQCNDISDCHYIPIKRIIKE